MTVWTKALQQKAKKNDVVISGTIMAQRRHCRKKWGRAAMILRNRFKSLIYLPMAFMFGQGFIFAQPSIAQPVDFYTVYPMDSSRYRFIIQSSDDMPELPYRRLRGHIQHEYSKYDSTNDSVYGKTLQIGPGGGTFLY